MPSSPRRFLSGKGEKDGCFPSPALRPDRRRDNDRSFPGLYSSERADVVNVDDGQQEGDRCTRDSRVANLDRAFDTSLSPALSGMMQAASEDRDMDLPSSESIDGISQTGKGSSSQNQMRSAMSWQSFTSAFPPTSGVSGGAGDETTVASDAEALSVALRIRNRKRAGWETAELFNLLDDVRGARFSAATAAAAWSRRGASVVDNKPLPQAIPAADLFLRALEDLLDRACSAVVASATAAGGGIMEDDDEVGAWCGMGIELQDDDSSTVAGLNESFCSKGTEVVSDRGLPGPMSQDGAAVCGGENRTSKGRGRGASPSAHLPRILPHVSYLRSIFVEVSYYLPQLAESRLTSPSELSAVTTRFSRLVEVLTEEVSSLLTAEEDDDLSLFEESPGLLDENEQSAPLTSTFEKLSRADKIDSQKSEGEGKGATVTTFLSSDEAAEAAVDSFRLVLAVLADGASLLQTAHKNMLKLVAKRRRMSFSSVLGSAGKQAQGYSLEMNGLNNRGMLAAMVMQRLVPKQKKIDDVEEVIWPDLWKDVEFEGATHLAPLTTWANNVDSVLADTSLSEPILSMKSCTKNDAVEFLIKTTVPTILTVESTKGAENTTAIMFALLKKRKRLRKLLAEEERALVLSEDQKILTLEQEALMGRWVSGVHARCRELVERSGIRYFSMSVSDFYRRQSKEARAIMILSVATCVMSMLNLLYAFHPPVFLALSAVGAMGLTERHLLRQAELRDLEVGIEDGEALPRLPHALLLRPHLHNEVVLSLLRHGKTKDSTATATILSGPLGSGTTTMAISAVHDSSIQGRYSDGIVWLSENKKGPRLSYNALIRLYGALCRQLAKNSHRHDLAKAAARFDPVEYRRSRSDSPGHEAALMSDLKSELNARLGLGRRRVLIVLDGLCDPSDLRWFRFEVSGVEEKSDGSALRNDDEQESEMNGRDVDKTTDAACQVLVATSARGSELPGVTNVVQIDPLSPEEATYFLKKQMAKPFRGHLYGVLSKERMYTPLALRCAAHVITSSDISDDWREEHIKDIFSLIAGGHSESMLDMPSLLSDAHPDTMLRAPLQEILVRSLEAMGHIGSVLRVCLTAFVTTFFDDPSFESSCDPYVPVKIATAFWDGVMNGEDISMEMLFQLELCLEAEKTSRGRAVSRTAFVSDRLVSLGVLRVVKSISSDGISNVKGYAVSHEEIRQFASAGNVDRKKVWSSLAVRTFQDCLIGGIKIPKGMRAGEKHGEEDEAPFILRHILEHLFRGNMFDEAMDLLTSDSFVRNRFSSIGYLASTVYQIEEAEYLLRQLQDAGFELLSKSSRIIFATEAKLSVISSYERLTHHLTELPHHENSNSALCILFMGQSLLRQGWYNEAFALLQESVTMCHVFNCYSPESSAAVNWTMARALHDIGNIYYKEKRHLMEATKSYAESLHYSRHVSSGNASQMHDVIRTLEALGNVNFDNADFEAALKVYYDLTFVLKSMFGIDNARYATVLERIGETHRKKGDTKNAEEVFSEVLRIRRLLHGNESYEVALILHCLGLVYNELGNTEHALHSIEESLKVWEALLSADMTCRDQEEKYATVLHDLGLIHRHRGELDGALNAYTAALKVRVAILGGQHDDTLQTLHNIGIVYCDKGALEEALSFYSRSLRLQRRKPYTAEIDERKKEMQSFTSALLASEALKIDAPSVEAVRERCVVMFGSDIRYEVSEFCESTMSQGFPCLP